jgi:hypothetical protein
MEDPMASTLNKVVVISAVHPFGLKVRFGDDMCPDWLRMNMEQAGELAPPAE